MLGAATGVSCGSGVGEGEDAAATEEAGAEGEDAAVTEETDGEAQGPSKMDKAKAWAKKTGSAMKQGALEMGQKMKAGAVKAGKATADFIKGGTKEDGKKCLMNRECVNSCCFE